MVLDITEEDLKAIETAVVAGGDIWNNPILASFKQKVKKHHLYIQGSQCCYCRRSMTDEFNMVIDIEHIIPKHKPYQKYMFEPFNLSVACKRCNMEIKGADVSFLVDKNVPKPEDRDSYKFIHPNFDDYFQHILYLVHTINDKQVIKYTIQNQSQKGDYTYTYFKLKEIEIDALNQVQGLPEKQQLLTKIPADTRKRLTKLLKKL